MEKMRISELSAYSKRWAAISLIENLTHFHSKNELKPKTQIPKRLFTDFFPGRDRGQTKYKEKNSFIISPDSYFKAVWDILKLSLILIHSFLIPYILTFIPPDVSQYQLTINSIEIFFLIDLLIQFNTGVYYNGSLFTSRRLIAKYYIRSNFIIDILSVFPYFLIIPEMELTSKDLFIPVTDKNAVKFLWLLKLLRIFLVKTLFYNIEEFLVSSIFFKPIRGLYFIFTVFIWTHWLACIIYYYYAQGLEKEPHLWLRYFDDVNDRYLRYFYLVLQTMTSVGFGDNLPITMNQRIVAIISMSFACVLFGNIIGNIQGYIQNWNADSKFYEDKVRKLKMFIKKNNLPQALRHRLVQYVYYIQKVEKNNSPKELEILEILSKPLREEVFTQTRGHLLAKSKVFRCYSGSFLKFLGLQMKIVTYATGDIIFKEGEKSAVIYYLCSGKVQIYHELTKTVFKDVKVSKYFGEISFFLDQPRSASAMCIEFGEFLTLNRCELMNILTYRPKEKELTNVIIHNTLKYSDLTLLGVRCYLCNKVGHVARDCKAYIIIPNTSDIIKKAQIKKFPESKIINPNILNQNPIIRPNLFYNHLKRQNLASTKGHNFKPQSQYNDRKHLISKANSIIAKSFKKTDINKLLSLKENKESEPSNRSFSFSDRSNSDNSMTFGKL